MIARTSGGCAPTAAGASSSTGTGCRPAPAGQVTRYGTVPDAVAWHEGMLLAPQHFQQAALHAEAVLGYHLAALSPWHWGVRRLALDCAALSKGTVRITGLDAVMPDGLVVRRREGDPVVETRLEPYAATAKDGVLTVHLCVRPRTAASDATGALARLECYAGEPVPDTLSGEGPTEVLRLRPRLALIVSRERPRGWVSFPMARVRQSGGAWTLAGDLPPILSLATAPALRDRCNALLCAVRGRATAIARTLRTERAAGRWAPATAAQPALSALVAILPRLEALVHAPAVHPHAVYLALCDLAGQLAAAGAGRVPPLLRGYDHDDPRRTFEPVLRFCEEALQEVQTGWMLLHFARRGGRFGVRPGSRGTGPQQLLLCAVAPAGTDRKALTAWVTQARIAPESQIAAVLRAAYSAGAAREVVEAPEGLSTAENRLYVRVTPGPMGADERLVVAPPAACGDRGRPHSLLLCLPAAPPAVPATGSPPGTYLQFDMPLVGPSTPAATPESATATA